ncbi:MAG: hypothetical protein L0Y54_10245 [Sporichthyaceae bacterium]|nr:hypothetical protein [Sporichthyaceae bacterium]
MVAGIGILQHSNVAEVIGAVPIDDGYTNTARPAPHDWNATEVRVGGQSNARHVGYLKFDLGQLPERHAPQLELNVTGDAGELEFYATEIGWNERTLSEKTAPARTGLLATAQVGSGKQRIVVEFPELLGEQGIYSFAVVRRAKTGTTELASSESGAKTTPRLRVVTPNTPTPGTDPDQPIALPNPSIPPTISETNRPNPNPSPSTTPPGEPTRSGSSGPCSISDKLVPSCGVWWGVAGNPIGGESYDQAMVDVEAELQRPADIAHYYHRGQGVLFPTAGEMNRAFEPGRNRILFINWRPTGLTWRAVADGAADGFLVRLAQHIKSTHPDPFFLSLNAEMEDEVNQTSGSGQTASDFRAFFRHVVQVLRTNGAANVVTVVGYVGAPHWGDVPWFDTLYPGDDVVDWIAEDPYAFGTGDIWRSDFAGMVDRVQNPAGSTWRGFYTWATTKHPSKPVMLGEWGVDDPADDPSYKPDFFRSAGRQLAQFPKLKALVYWNAANFHMVGNTRVDSSAASLAAIRDFVWLDVLSNPGRAYLR